MANARAFLGNHDVNYVFSFNPDMVEWGYQENIHSQDTLGGRVVQLLSIKVNTMTVTASAGSRAEIQRLAAKTKEIMKWHIDHQLPVTFRVPSRKWEFQVYIQDLPRIGWDVYATTYPFQLNLAVNEDLHINQDDILTHELSELAKGIGYDPAVHGGDPSAFQSIVDDLLKSRASAANVGAGGKGGGSGDNSQLPGYRNPLRAIRGLYKSRLDMGIDYSGSGPIYAVGPGIVTFSATGTGWGPPAGAAPGGAVVVRLTSGSRKDMCIYVAEGIQPRVRVHDRVDSSKVIGTMVNGIEMGWADPSGSDQTLYVHNHGHWGDGNGCIPTRESCDFQDFMKAIGGPLSNCPQLCH